MNKEKKLEFKIDEKIGSGEYANIANIIFNDSEFVMDFGRVSPGIPVAEVRSRIIMNPKNAKMLKEVLIQTIKNYEDKFGEIKFDRNESKNIGFKAENK